MAFNTIHALKKKMHFLKTEKENASDRADQLEQKLSDQKILYDKVKRKRMRSKFTCIRQCMQSPLGASFTIVCLTMDAETYVSCEPQRIYIRLSNAICRARFTVVRRKLWGSRAQKKRSCMSLGILNCWNRVEKNNRLLLYKDGCSRWSCNSTLILYLFVLRSSPIYWLLPRLPHSHHFLSFVTKN
jgi:hypothetical protein